MHKRILVTGSNGQLGSDIQAYAEKSSTNFIFTDINELDISDKQAVDRFLKTHNVEVIINCAAYTQVDKAEDEAMLADAVNHLAVNNLAQCCKNNQATLIHISTDYVFDGTGHVPYRENMPASPLGVYGRTKLEGEKAIITSNCNYLIIRTSWLYSSFGSNFMKTMRKLTSERNELKVVFDQIGTPTYAADLAQVIINIVEQKQYISHGGIYHYSNEGVCSWYDFAIEIRDVFDHNCKISPCHSDEFPSKVKRPNYSVLDKTKIKTDFGIEIPHWKESLRKCAEFM